MPEMHLKQPGFTYSACGPFTKNRERIQKFKETGDTASDKVLRDKAFNIAKDPNIWWITKRSCFYGLQIFWLKIPGSGVPTLASNEIKQNLQ